MARRSDEMKSENEVGGESLNRSEREEEGEERKFEKREDMEEEI